MKLKSKLFLKNWLYILVGSLLYSIGVGLFLKPNGLASGGVYGLSIILNAIFNKITVARFIIALNIPILIIGIWRLGLKFLVSTIITLLIQTGILEVIENLNIPNPTDDRLLAAVAGGCLIGVAVGLIFRGGSTSGGSDVVVRILRQKYKYLKSGMIFMIVDGCVVLLSGIVNGFTVALYSAICLFILSYVLNLVLYGTDTARMVYIISNKDEVIAKRIMSELSVGVTYLSGAGGYTNQNKRILLCAMRRNNVPLARQIVLEEDEGGFMIVTSANEVLGHGFKRLDSEEL